MFSPKRPREHSDTVGFLTSYLDPQLITTLHAQTRDGAIVELVELLDGSGKLKNKEQFFQAILEREKIVSTGIGMGIALPHAKLLGYTTFFIALGISPRGIPWDALDGVPVRLVFMIGGPEDQQTEYLQLLSRLTLIIKDDERRKKILQSSRTEDIIALLQG